MSSMASMERQRALRPVVALFALCGFLGAQVLLPGLFVMSAAQAQGKQQAKARQAAQERTARQRVLNMAQTPPPAWYLKARKQEQTRQKQVAAIRLAQNARAAQGARATRGTGAAQGIRSKHRAQNLRLTQGIRLAQAGRVESSQPGRIAPSERLYVPNPRTSPKALNLEGELSQLEISMAGQMCGALAPTDIADVDKLAERLEQQGVPELVKAVKVERLKDGNRLFARAIQAWNEEEFEASLRLLDQFSVAYADSPWAAEALIHIADDAKFKGRFTQAQALYQQIMAQTSAAPGPMSYEAHQKAYERWADLDILLGRWDEAWPKLQDIAENDLHWRRRTWAAYWLGKLELYRQPGNIRLARACGTEALSVVLASLGRDTAAKAMARLKPPRDAGFSVAELEGLSRRFGVPMRGFKARAEQLASLPTPLVLHLDYSGLQARERAWRQGWMKRRAQQQGQQRVAQKQQQAAQRQPRVAQEPMRVRTVASAQMRPLARMQAAQAKQATGQKPGSKAPRQSPSQSRSQWQRKTRRTTPALPPSALPPSAMPSGHFLVVRRVDAEQGMVHLDDPQTKGRYALSYAQLDREWSGVGLVRRDAEALANSRASGQGSALPVRWLSPSQSKRLLGGCYVVAAQDDLDCNANARTSKGGCPDGGCGGDDDGGGGDDDPLVALGEPSVMVNQINHNVIIKDTPLWRAAPIGPSVAITMTYNSLDASNYNSGFGNKWSFNYGTHLVEVSGGQVTLFMPGGRQDKYNPDGAGGYTAPVGVYNTLVKTGTNAWELRFQQGGKFVYAIPAGTTSQTPFLTELHDRWGYKLTFGYNSNVQLTTITDAQNKVTTLTYDANGRITRATDPFERVASFSYDASGNLIECVDMEGHAFQYTYDAAVKVTQLGTAQGPWSFSYYNLYASTGYDDKVTVTNPLSQNEVYDYGGHGNYYYIDQRGVIPNNRTTMYATVVDGEGKISEVMAPTASYYGSDTVQHTYDTATGLITSTVSSISQYPYQYSYQRADYTYNAQGRVTSIKEGPYGQRDGISYNGFPNAYTRTTTISYAANGLDVTSVTNALNQTPSTTTYNAYHQPTQVTNALNNTSSATYTAWGALASTTDAGGQVTTYNYDTTTKQLTSVSRGGATLASYTYDNIGRVRTETDANNLTISYDYNNLDQVTKVRYPDGTFESIEYVCCGLPGMVTDRSGRRSYSDYDALKRLTRTQDAAGNSVQLEYDVVGNRTRLIDAKGQITRWAYDNRNRLTRKTYADGTYDSYSYDDYGMLSSQRNARGQVTTYSYNGHDNLTLVNYATMADVSVSYDALDRVTQMTDGIGTTAFGYDVLSRSTSVDGPFANDTVSYTYDSEGRRATLKVNNTDQVSYGYDTLERLSSLTSPAGQFTYSYLGNTGMLSQLNRPNGTYSSFSYDSLERLTGVGNRKADASLISGYSYGYNTRDVRTWMENQVGTNPIQRVNYSYDAIDQLTSEASTEGTPQLNTSYAYDPMGNRSSAQASGTLTGSYTSSYNANKLNQLTSYATTSNGSTTTRNLSYDAGGNLTRQALSTAVAGSGSNYTYDEASRLTQILQVNEATGVNERKSEFVYDAFSRKVISREFTWTNGAWVQSSETRRIYDGLNVVQERDGANAVTVNYTRSGNIGGLLARSTAQGHFYYHYDGSGNVMQLTDAAQATVADYKYDAYGNLLTSSGTQAGQPYRYSTKEYHSPTGLYDYGFRFYSPSLGRWINRDPIEEDGGLNLYGFVGNNPVNYADPYGLARVELHWRDVYHDINVTKTVLGKTFTFKKRVTTGSHAYILVWDTDTANNKVGAPKFYGGYKGNGMGGGGTGLNVLQGFYAPPAPAGGSGCPDYHLRPGHPNHNGMLLITDPKDNNSASAYIARLNAVAAAINALRLTYPKGGIGKNSNSVARTLIQRGLGIDVRDQLPWRHGLLGFDFLLF